MDDLNVGGETLSQLCQWLRRRHGGHDAAMEGRGEDPGPGADAIGLGTPLNYDDTAWAQAMTAESTADASGDRPLPFRFEFGRRILLVRLQTPHAACSRLACVDQAPL